METSLKAIREPSVVRKVLLICGVVSSLLYVAMNVYFPTQWDGYSSFSQTVSELSAVGAPTRPLWVLFGSVYAFLLTAFVSKSRSVSSLHRKLHEVGVPSVYVEFPRTDHAFDLVLPGISPAAQAAMYDVDRFLALMASPIDWSGATLSATGRPRGDN